MPKEKHTADYFSISVNDDLKLEMVFNRLDYHKAITVWLQLQKQATKANGHYIVCDDITLAILAEYCKVEPEFIVQFMDLMTLYNPEKVNANLWKTNRIIRFDNIVDYLITQLYSKNGRTTRPPTESDLLQLSIPVSNVNQSKSNVLEGKESNVMESNVSKVSKVSPDGNVREPAESAGNRRVPSVIFGNDETFEIPSISNIPSTVEEFQEEKEDLPIQVTTEDFQEEKEAIQNPTIDQPDMKRVKTILDMFNEEQLEVFFNLTLNDREQVIERFGLEYLEEIQLNKFLKEKNLSMRPIPTKTEEPKTVQPSNDYLSSEYSASFDVHEMFSVNEQLCSA